MNYYEWSKEYAQSAEALDKIISRLKEQRKRVHSSHRKELDDRIAFYKVCRNECVQTADHLMQRYEGVA